jgi:hypothetical protein
MGQTAKYALPWPEASDPADGPLAFQNLANATEAALLGAPAASLPASPVNGQVARYLVTANGPIWSFVYVAASTAPKWHFIGGGPFVHETSVTGGPAGGGASYTDFGPSFNPSPLAGDYQVEYGGFFTGTVGTAIGNINFKIAGVAPADDSQSLKAQPAGTNYATAGMNARSARYLGVSAGAAWLWVGKINSGGLTMTERFAYVTPIRVS